jgi:hypothetical protein
MALSITQTPALISLAQSPIIFTVSESNSGSFFSSSFQYVGELSYQNEFPFGATSPTRYTIVKYPNASNVGIFDLNRIINSLFTTPAEILTGSSALTTPNVKSFSVKFYTQWLQGSTYVTGSNVTSNSYIALDGYGLFPTPIGTAIQSQSVHWPIMTAGPATQSVLPTNTGGLSFYAPYIDVVYSGSNGQTAIVNNNIYANPVIVRPPTFPSSPGFPLSGSLDWYTIQAADIPFGTAGQPIRFNVVCPSKYPNVRIKWKNQFGQFDFFNFNMVNKQSFTTEKKTYQPQLGSWNASTLTYQNYDSSTLNYVVDAKQSISVNTDWVDESYNEIFKQLLVTDEAYWIYNEAQQLLRPITIDTSTIVFKTGVVDKVIQYAFDFNFGQQYKLII